MECDEKHVQGGGLFRGRDGLALELEFAELRPANPVQVGTGVHVLQEHYQGVTMLVFYWLKIYLAEVLGSQHSLRKIHQKTIVLLFFSPFSAPQLQNQSPNSS